MFKDSLSGRSIGKCFERHFLFYSVIGKILFRSVMVSAFVYPVTSPDLISYGLTGTSVDVPGELVRLPATGTIMPGCPATVELQNVTPVHLPRFFAVCLVPIRTVRTSRTLYEWYERYE